MILDDDHHLEFEKDSVQRWEEEIAWVGERRHMHPVQCATM